MMKVSEIRRADKQAVGEQAKNVVRSPRKTRSVSAGAKAAAAAALPQNGGSHTEEVLAQLLGKFSYDSLAAEIRRSIKEELAAANVTAAAAPAAPAETAEAEQGRSAGDFTDELLAELIGMEKSDLPATKLPQTEAAQAVPVASIFNEDALKEAARLDAEERAPSASAVDDDEDFDIMALLDSEVQKMESSSPIDMMDVFGDKVVKVSLEELTKYNSKQG